MKRLNPWDALFLYSETPNVHQHTLKIAVIDTSGFEGGTADLASFTELFRQRLHRLEPLRYQLVDIPLHLHRPMWRENVDLDLEYHIRRVQVPAPGGRRELDQLIGEIASTPLDRHHPLWVLYYAEGMADNKVAAIVKIHHALADGMASANLMALAMEWPGGVVERDPYDPDPSPSRGELLKEAAFDHLGQLRRFPQSIASTVTGVAKVRRTARERGQHPELARNFSPPKTFINHRLSPVRTFATATLSLAEVKETGKSLGVTINDIVLSMSAGALRELLLRHGGSADVPIIAGVPASIDTSPDRISGNELSMMAVSVPVHQADPLERVKLTHIATRKSKEDHELLGKRTITTWIEYAPVTTIRGVFKYLSQRDAPNSAINLTISNVPGPRQRGAVAGSIVSEVYSVGPLAVGAGINITVWSYVDQLNISVLADGDTLSEPHEATDAMLRAFAEIRAAAGLPEFTAVDTAMPQATNAS